MTKIPMYNTEINTDMYDTNKYVTCKDGQDWYDNSKTIK